ncbi:MAG: histidine triad nucleotide-binding protein [Chlamydiales bacterium]|nr:histidine triad nucleotide-binding protein [Chlamydiales bacterium]
MKTIFERIIAGEIDSEKVFENEHILAIKDIYPVAPVHILIMPKKHFSSIQAVGKEDLWLIGEIMRAVQILAMQFKIVDNYRVLTNNGHEAGQTIFHLHFHLIGGRSFGTLG